MNAFYIPQANCGLLQIMCASELSEVDTVVLALVNESCFLQYK